MRVEGVGYVVEEEARQGGEHTMQHGCCLRNLHNVINQRHPNQCNKRDHKIQ